MALLMPPPLRLTGLGSGKKIKIYAGNPFKNDVAKNTYQRNQSEYRAEQSGGAH